MLETLGRVVAVCCGVLYHAQKISRKLFQDFRSVLSGVTAHIERPHYMCSMLQRVVVCCSVLQCVAERCRAMQRTERYTTHRLSHERVRERTAYQPIRTYESS